jgi:KDO2-lipid IV(A) lauroyltransferase
MHNIKKYVKTKRQHTPEHQQLSIRDILTGSIEIIVHWVLRILPISLCSSIGFFLGKIIGPMHRQATHQLRENIKRLRPDVNTPEQLKKMIKRSWGNYGRVMAEFSVLRRIWRSNRTEIDGIDNLIASQASKRPIIYTFLHLGNWEIIGPKLLDLVSPNGIQIYQKIEDRFKLYIAENVRRPYAHALITNSPYVGKKIYNKLIDRYFLNIAVDEFINNKLSAPSFGRPLEHTSNLSFAVRLAKLTNAVICPVYTTRKNGAYFTLHILPPIMLDFTEFNRVKLQEAVSQLDQLIDPIVRKHFDQWYYCATPNLSKRNPINAV